MSWSTKHAVAQRLINILLTAISDNWFIVASYTISLNSSKASVIPRKPVHVSLATPPVMESSSASCMLTWACSAKCSWMYTAHATNAWWHYKFPDKSTYTGQYLFIGPIPWMGAHGCTFTQMIQKHGYFRLIWFLLIRAAYNRYIEMEMCFISKDRKIVQL